MVNTGQPSDGCIQCRARKVKCDATRPACTRCTKLGIVCPGYARREPLMFRDVSQETKRRADHIYQSLDKRDSSRSRRNLSVRTREGGKAPTSNADNSLTLQPFSFYRDTILTGSVSAFYSDWNKDTISILESNIMLAGNLYPSCSSCLVAAVEALSLWALSASGGAGTADVSGAAREKYALAIRETRSATRKFDGDEHHKNQIMLAIELMGMFEVFMHTMGPRDGAAGHLYGLLTAISNRGYEQFTSELGRRIFLDACVFFHIGSMVYPEPLPFPMSSDIYDVLLSIPGVSQIPEYTMLPLINRSLNLRISSRAELGPLATPQTIDLLLTQVIQLNQELDSWFETIPEYYTASNLVSKIILPNFYRYHQVFLQDILVRAYYQLQEISADSAAFNKELSLAFDKTQRMVEDMCMSMPYTFNDADPHFFKRPMSGKEVMHHATFSPFLLVCSMVECLSEEQHERLNFARFANAKAAGVNKPFRTFPRILVPSSPSKASYPTGLPGRAPSQRSLFKIGSQADSSSDSSS